MARRLSFQQIVDSLLRQHKDEIEQAPDFFGYRVEDPNWNNYDDGANYGDTPERPSFIREDLNGWVEVDERGVDLKATIERLVAKHGGR